MENKSINLVLLMKECNDGVLAYISKNNICKNSIIDPNYMMLAISHVLEAGDEYKDWLGSEDAAGLMGGAIQCPIDVDIITLMNTRKIIMSAIADIIMTETGLSVEKWRSTPMGGDSFKMSVDVIGD